MADLASGGELGFGGAGEGFDEAGQRYCLCRAEEVFGWPGEPSASPAALVAVASATHELGVATRIPADSEVPRLRPRRIRPDGDALVLLVVSAEEVGLSAAVTVQTVNGDGLDGFLAGLDKDFRGWPGGRRWKSHEGDLELEAVHTGRTILLAWTLRLPSPAEESWDWQATVRVAIAPGEELKTWQALSPRC